jgi:glycosyltransferase involved in cell wall biosynthesis
MKRLLVDRSTALLAPPDSPEALASALGELLENADLRRSLGANARREAIEKHSWDRAVREVETVLCGLVEARGRRLASGARRSAGAAIEAIEPRGEPRLP